MEKNENNMGYFELEVKKFYEQKKYNDKILIINIIFMLIMLILSLLMVYITAKGWGLV